MYDASTRSGSPTCMAGGERRRRAHLLGDRRGHLVAPRAPDPRQRGEVLRPVRPAQAGPVRERRPGRGDGAVDVVLGAVGDVADCLLGGGILHRDARFGARRHPLAAHVDHVTVIHSALSDLWGGEA